MNWILFGFKRAGKTYFGNRLGLPFIDTDALIETQEQMAIQQIIEKKGEPYFRQIEKKAILSLDVQNTVIATGGGTVLDPDNLQHLQTLGLLIYLDCPKTLLKERLLTSPLPTFLDASQLEASFEKHYCTRILKYEKIPSIHIALQNKTDLQILEELWQAINLATSSALPRGENRMAKPLESS